MEKIKRSTVKELLSNPEAHIDRLTDVKGWVRTRRGNKNVQFIALNDGSTIKNLQLVADMSKFSEEDLKPITTGAAIHAQGIITPSQGKGQTVEMQIKELEVYGTADPDTYPLQKLSLIHI
mgnify:FL=1